VRFPIRFTGVVGRVLAVLGMGPATSYVEVSSADVTVRMGWGFRTVFPRSSVHSAGADHEPVWGWGAHGWRGTWLVNGSSRGLVRIDVDPPARARVLGLPVHPRALRISVEDPDGLLRALAAEGGA
jgi:hypothetical protein